MPKISRVSQLILVLGILLIAFVGLFLVLKGQVGAQENLTQNLGQARSTLTKLAQLPPTKSADLESKVQAAEAELQDLEAQFPGLDQNLVITENLLNLAEQSELKVTDMSTTLAKKKINKVEYQILNLTVTLEGDLASMVGFISKLKTELPTAEIVSFNLVKAENVQNFDTGTLVLCIYLGRTN